MSVDKRTVSTDALETLGTIIDETAGRDAIHLAVEPVIARRDLYAGQHVTLYENGMAGPGDNPVGIVDPFLKDGVKRGDRFWLVVYPRQITSLRHVWTHPAFEVITKPEVSFSKKESEVWLRNFCDNHDCVSYETVMAAIDDKLKDVDHYGEAVYKNDDYWTFMGRDAHCDIPDEFWENAENVVGHKITDKVPYFSCSC